MLTLWLGFFLIGGCFGRTFGGMAAGAWVRWFGAVLGLACAAVGGRSGCRRRAALAALAGLCWGYGNSALLLPPGAAGVTLRVAAVGPAAALVPHATGPVVAYLVARRRGESVGEGGRYYEINGSLQQDALGVVTIAPGAPRLFARQRSRFRRQGGAASPGGSPLAAAAAALGLHLRQNLRHTDRATAAWLAGILLADRRGMPASAAAAFRLTGLAHLLAASGLHVAILVTLVSGAVRLPLQLAYAARLIGPRAWRHAAASAAVVSATLALVYLAATGMPVAAQRATLGFALVQVARVFAGLPPVTRRLALTGLLQALLFPIGFVSEATLMSWGAYLLVIDAGAAAARPRRPPPSRPGHLPLRALLALQLRLLVLAGAAYGPFSPVALLANLTLVPVFVPLLPLGLALAVWPRLPGRSLVLALHRSFREIVGHLAHLAPATGDLPPAARAAAAGVAAVLLLNTCRRLSIRAYESR